MIEAGVSVHYIDNSYSLGYDSLLQPAATTSIHPLVSDPVNCCCHNDGVVTLVVSQRGKT